MNYLSFDLDSPDMSMVLLDQFPIDLVFAGRNDDRNFGICNIEVLCNAFFGCHIWNMKDRQVFFLGSLSKPRVHRMRF